MRKLLVILFILIIYFSDLLSQDIGSAFEGKHFYISFLQNEIPDAERVFLQIIMVSNYPADVIVKIPGESDKLYSIPSNYIQKIYINSSLELVENEMIVQKSIEIISTVPILVYTFSSQLNSSSCFTAVPVSQWGYEYVVMSYPNDQYTSSFDYWGRLDSALMIPRKSEFVVMASENDTRVEITPRSVTQSLRQKDQPHFVTMQKGDCYLVQSYDFPIGMGDLTGSLVRSDKPVGVISGHVRTAVPQFMDRYFESKDHIATMLTPTNAWGRQFYSVPFEMHNGGDLFRIVTMTNNTVVNVEMEDTSFSFVIDNAFSFKDLPAIKKPAKWSSNNPVQIGQFMMRIGGIEDNFDYDPALVILPPAEQFVQKMIFQTVGNEPTNPEQFVGYEIYVIANNEALSSLKLNNDLVKDAKPEINNQFFPDSLHHWVRIPISMGSYRLSCDSGSFSGIAYAFGRADSYALTLGSSLSNPFSNDSLSPEIVIGENCGNISGTITEVMNSDASGLLFAVMTDASFNYSFELNPKIMDSTYSTTFTARPKDVMKDGKFVLEYRDKNGNGKNYTYNYYGINFNVPGTISLGVVNKGDTNCFKHSIKVNGNQTVQLDSVVIRPDNDRRFEFKPKTVLPATLYPNDTYEFEVCFHPDSSFDDLYQLLYFYFDCNRFDSLIVMGMVRYPDMEFVGWDFGEVCLGDTAWGEIKIINTGNVSVLIDTLDEILANNQFEIILRDSLGANLLPKNLGAGEIMLLKVRYIPKNKGYTERVITAVNNLNFQNQIRLTGTGIAPFISSTIIDWGKRRIGSINDTLIYLKNTGECKADIYYNGSDGNLIPFFIDSVKNLNTQIEINDSLGLFFSFNPPQTQNYLLVTFFKVDSPGHDLVNVTKKGEGTLPIIKPINIEFDTIPIYSLKDSLCLVIKSLGNERLWIDFNSVSGDDSCFIINGNNTSIFKNRYIEPDSALIIPITFNPKKLGMSQMTISLKHDAFPAFNRGDTSIIITGYSVEVDTLSPDIYFESNLVYLPCHDDLLPVYFKNNGNVDLSLDSISLSSVNIDAKWNDNFTLPIIIKPDSVITLFVKIFPKANETGKISVSGVFNDTIHFKSEDLEILMNVLPLSIDDFGFLNYKIGDKATLIISGKFPKGAQIAVDFSLEIELKHKYMHLINNDSKLMIIDGNDTARYDLPFSQTLNGIVGRTKEELRITDSSRWQVQLDFLTLLAEKNQTTMTVKAKSEICYSEAIRQSELNFYGVCSFDIRRVEFDETGLFDIEISPNPVREELCIKINLLSDNWINLSIFDENGKKILQNENYFLKKGTNSLIFELMPLANGVYILSARSKLMLKNIMFIITK
ncbi:hypothetical protein D9V86_04425 [Bacteroidetes/Chlorobi group bacterium ChocPot_Mid]|nr:MAG: hypothetical protein D9V86_04425 [Bacteroidetes/Chlorobi group bacterium ChocPot_Mid]